MLKFTATTVHLLLALLLSAAPHSALAASGIDRQTPSYQASSPDKQCQISRPDQAVDDEAPQLAERALGLANAGFETGHTNHAYDNRSSIFIEGGARAGGDKLSSRNVTCVDIFFRETSCPRGFRIGGGIHLAVGYKFYIGDKQSEALSLALGYLWESSFEEKTSATILEATYLHHFGLNRVGIGLSYHLDPKYEEEISDSLKKQLDFDDALGIVFKLGYLIRDPDWLLGVRFTIMDYQTGGDEVDASSLGVYVSKSLQ